MDMRSSGWKQKQEIQDACYILDTDGKIQVTIEYVQQAEGSEAKVEQWGLHARVVLEEAPSKLRLLGIQHPENEPEAPSSYDCNCCHVECVLAIMIGMWALTVHCFNEPNNSRGALLRQ